MSIAKNSVKITAIGMVGMGSGVAVDAIMMAFFGLSEKTDAFFVASTVPVTLITIVALQAQKVIQPIFIHRRTTAGEAAGWRFLNNIVLLGTLLTTVLCVVGISLAGPITSVQMMSPDEATKTLARQLAIFMFCAPVLMCPCTFYCSALLGLGEFVVPGTTRLVENIAKIVIAMTLFSRIGIFVLPVGLLLGTLVQNVHVYLALRRHGYRFQWRLHRADFNAGAMLMHSSYPFAGHVLTMGIEVLQNTLATSLGSGTLSALRLAIRMIDAFSGLVANSVVTATTPVVIRQISAGQIGEMKASMTRSIRLLLLLTLPAIAWLITMGRPTIEFLFQRRNFTAEDTALVALIMAIMAPYVFLSRLYGLAELPFYGARDTKTPLIAQVALAIFYSVSIVVFSKFFQVLGFPLARSVSYLGGCAILLLLIHRYHGSLGWRSIGEQGLRVTGAALAFGLAAHGAHRALEQLEWSGAVWNGCMLAVSGVVGLIVFFGVAVLTGAIARARLQQTTDSVLQRLKLRTIPSTG